MIIAQLNVKDDQENFLYTFWDNIAIWQLALLVIVVVILLRWLYIRNKQRRK